MPPPLQVGDTLNKYKIIDIFGWAEGTAAYLVNDLTTQERLLLWESAAMFALRSKPPGAREYFQEGDRRYLVLRLEGQTLAFLLTAAGRLEESPAGLWMLQICQAIGYWHNRPDGALVCLRQGDLTLADFQVTGHDTALVSSYGDLGRTAGSGPTVGDHRFSAPERTPETLSPRSDVYALGAILYCLLTGQPPPEPEARLARQVKLASPRQVNPNLSHDMDKVVRKALQLDPRRRYPTAAEMADDLAKFLTPQATEEAKPKRKPSLLMKVVPFFASLLLLVCVVLALDRALDDRLAIKIPWLPGWPTPTFTPTLPATPANTPTPTPTPTLAPIPASEVVLHQIRLDRFPETVAYASVLDDQQDPIVALPRERFRLVLDDAEIADFQLRNVDAAQDPLVMVVAIDISGSMKGEPLKKARVAAANFVGRFDPGDEVSLVKFDDRIEWVHDFTTDKEAVIQAIQSLRTRGDTALYDVIAYAVEKLENKPGRRAAIILTDGRDTASVKHTLDSCLVRVNEAGIPIFVIGLNSKQFTPQVMATIASRTGGEYLFAPGPDDLDALYQKMRGQLQNQYRIEFIAPHGADGARHILTLLLAIGAEQELASSKEYRVP